MDNYPTDHDIMIHERKNIKRKNLAPSKQYKVQRVIFRVYRAKQQLSLSSEKTLVLKNKCILIIFFTIHYG